MRLAWVLGSFLLIVSAVSSRAATLRVPSEYPAISLAVGAASAGDTVLVAPGVYTNCDTEPCTSRVVDLFEGLTVLSEGGRDVTRLELVGAAGLTTLRVVRGVGIGIGGARVEGFEIRSSVADSRAVALVDCENVTVSSCRVMDVATSFPSGGGLFQNGGSLEVIDCEFIRCTAVDIGGGMDAIGTFTSKTAVRDCYFEECGPTALAAGGGGDVEVTGCTFVRNFGPGGAGVQLSGNDSAVVRECWFEENTSSYGPGGLAISGPVGGPVVVVERCMFLRNDASNNSGGVGFIANSLLTESTFVGNTSPLGSAVRTANSARSHTIRNCVFGLNMAGPAVYGSSDGSAADGDCNVFWQNPAGDYFRYLQGSNDQFVDPEFCDIPNDDYTVRSTSPCAEENSPDCGQIGAYGVGCGTVSVAPTTFGRIKAAYRDGGRP